MIFCVPRYPRSGLKPQCVRRVWGVMRGWGCCDALDFSPESVGVVGGEVIRHSGAGAYYQLGVDRGGFAGRYAGIGY